MMKAPQTSVYAALCSKYVCVLFFNLSVFFLRILTIFKHKNRDIKTSRKPVLWKICKEKRYQAAACLLQDFIGSKQSVWLIDTSSHRHPSEIPGSKESVGLSKTGTGPGTCSFPCLENYRMLVIQGGEIKAFL